MNIFFSPRLRALLGLGFSSGLPLALSGATLQAWMASEGLSVSAIGWLTLAGIPYAWKFLWAPLMDRFTLPWLGRRRGWILLTQMLLVLLIMATGRSSPTTHPWQLGMLALVMAFVSASQDIVIDAYRSDLLQARERGMGAGWAVTGYRLAMLCSGALALVLAAHWGWAPTFDFMALLMGLCMVVTWNAPEPEVHPSPPHSIGDALRLPLRDFLQRPHAWSLLSLVFLYKLGDVLATALTSAFLIQGAGFSLTEVGMVNKGIGLVSTLAGTLLGGALMVRWKLYRALWVFGLLQGLSALSYALLSLMGHHLGMMVAAVFLENFTAGLGTTALTVLLMTLCNPRFSATQFALLSAVASAGRVYAGPLAGTLVNDFGWTAFFLCSVAASWPGLWLVWKNRFLLSSLK